MQRRKFLHQSILGGAAALAGAQPVLANTLMKKVMIKMPQKHLPVIMPRTLECLKTVRAKIL
jgi:hypothetical protein